VVIVDFDQLASPIATAPPTTCAHAAYRTAPVAVLWRRKPVVEDIRA
jgi:hypothetical protein